MTVVRLGNPAPQMQVKVPTITEDEEIILVDASVPAKHLKQTITTASMRAGFDDEDEVELALSTNNDRMLVMIARELGADLRRYAVGVAEVEQFMQVHSGGVAPTWVSCEDDPAFEEAIAKHYDCMRGEPTMLLTNLGRDDLHAQHLGTAAQPAAHNFMGLTANATAPSAANVALPSEITTASGGLIRKQATHAHSAGTNTSTLTATFTANGSDSLPVTIAKIGVFRHITTSNLMGYETLLNATATITVSGDSLTVTHTITAG